MTPTTQRSRRSGSRGFLHISASSKIKYTIPIIHDSTTNRTIVDSMRIIHCLDVTYPSTPRILQPVGGGALLAAAFDRLVKIGDGKAFYPLIVSRIAYLLPDEPSRTKYRAAVEDLIKVKLEDFLANTKLQEELWGKLEASFNVLNDLIDAASLVESDESKRGAETPSLGGSTLGAADVTLSAGLYWIARVIGEDDEHWKRVCSWNGGRWGKLYERYKPYYEIH